MPIEVLDPTWGDRPEPFTAAAPLHDLDGATVGIISNGKAGTRAFFEALGAELQATHGAADVVVLVKDNYSAPAGTEVMDRTSQWHALISGIGD